jgi:hypothetical protein
MNRQDGLSILITFVIGVVVGGYFYLTGFSLKTFSTTTQDTYKDFAIVGESYGDCGSVNGCASFQLLGDRSYRVLHNSQDIGNELIREGDISNSLRKELQKNLVVSVLEQQSEETSASNCASGNDGIDYSFRVTLDGENYLLDTCKTAVEYDSKAWLSLAKLWNYFIALK